MPTQSEQEERLLKAKAQTRALIGSRVTCILTDGRKASGVLICVDRLTNLILADCTEERLLSSKDYNAKSSNHSVTQRATRRLQQAMIPGSHLVRVEMDRGTYLDRIKRATVPAALVATSSPAAIE